MDNYKRDNRDIEEILWSDDEFPDDCVETPDIPAYLIDDRFDEITFPWLDNMKVRHFDKEIPYIEEDDNKNEEKKPKVYDPFDDDDDDDEHSNTVKSIETNIDKVHSSPDVKESEDVSQELTNDDGGNPSSLNAPDMKESKNVTQKPQNKDGGNPSSLNAPDMKESKNVTKNKDIGNGSHSQKTGTTSHVTKNEKGLRSKKKNKASVKAKDGGRVYNALPGLVQSNPCYQTTLIYEGFLMQSDLICLEYYENYAYNDEYFIWTINHYKYKSIMRQYHFYPGVLVPDMYCNQTPDFNSAPANMQRKMHYTFCY